MSRTNLIICLVVLEKTCLRNRISITDSPSNPHKSAYLWKNLLKTRLILRWASHHKHIKFCAVHESVTIHITYVGWQLKHRQPWTIVKAEPANLLHSVRQYDPLDIIITQFRHIRTQNIINSKLCFQFFRHALERKAILRKLRHSHAVKHIRHHTHRIFPIHMKKPNAIIIKPLIYTYIIIVYFNLYICHRYL